MKTDSSQHACRCVFNVVVQFIMQLMVAVQADDTGSVFCHE